MELTDGRTTCYAIEYTPIPSLTTAIKRGAKIAVQNVRVENGLLLLNPTNVLLLGGTVCECFIHQTLQHYLKHLTFCNSIFGFDLSFRKQSFPWHTFHQKAF